MDDSSADWKRSSTYIGDSSCLPVYNNMPTRLNVIRIDYISAVTLQHLYQKMQIL